MNALHNALAVLAALTTRTSRRVGRGARDAGASALEFAIIAAVTVVMASVIGAVIYNIVEDKSTDLQTCADQAVSDKCAP